MYIFFYILYNIYITMPSKMFWQSENKIPIGQSSIALPSENNLDHTAGQKVQFHIPASTEFINPAETYFKCDCEISIPGGAKTNLQLDADIGGQVLIKDIRVRTRDGILLEEIQNYNTLVSVMYDYNVDDNLRKKRSMTEGTTIQNPLCGTNGGCVETNKNDVLSNPYFKRQSVAPTDNTLGFKKAKLLLPLHTGIFQNSKVFPVMLVDGVIVEMILEENHKVFRQLDTVLLGRNAANNPAFLNVDGADATADLADGSTLTEFYVDPDTNSQFTVENFPFRIGETFKFVDTASMNVENDVLTTDEVTADTGASFTITGIVADSGAGSKNKIKVSVTSATTDGSGEDLSNDHVLVSTSAYGTDFDPIYTLSNLELIVQQLQMPDGYKSSLMSSMKSGGTMVYDFLSYSNYRFSTLKSENVINLRLPLQNSRAKAIWCVGTDATNRSVGNIAGAFSEASGTSVGAPNYFQFKDAHAQSTATFSDRAGLEGCVDFLSNYQFLYDNKLQPNRRVDCTKTGNKKAISQQPLVELEKALAMGGVEPRSFRKYNKNFVIGRALSLGDGVYDCRGKDFSLQLEYNGTDQTVNKLWNCYCAHLRGLQISGQNVVVNL